MLLDARELPNNHALTADLCIVGAGAAGIAMAVELIGSGIDVLVLESGGLEPEAQTQALYAGTVVNTRLHSPPDRYRQRRFGGSTTIWGGRCVPMDPIDFEARGYLPHSGWPLTRDELLPFYRRANQLCEAGAMAYTAAEAFTTPRRPMLAGFRSPHFTTDSLERFSCPTDFGTRYRDKLRAAPNVRVVLHANLTGITLDASGTLVEALVVRTLNGHERGKTFDVRARDHVLALGGLETARMLLAHREVQSQGIGNEHDAVGRYYMCHIAGTIGTLHLDLPRESIWNGYDLSDEGVYCRRRLALSAASQHQLGIGNFIARLHHPRIADPAHGTGILSLLMLAKAFIPYEYGKRLHGDEPGGIRRWGQHVANVLGDPGATAAFLWHWLHKRTLAERKFPSVVVEPRVARYSLDFHSEQQPQAASRVMLSSECDALGIPRLHIDWRYSEWDLRTVRRALDLFAHDVAESGIGRFVYDPKTLETEVMRDGAYGGHHLGTARMGTDPRTSVVDADGLVHGMRNLFVAGGATFPTSSQANPTLTIVALALRLAGHLQSRATLGIGQARPAAANAGSFRARAAAAEGMPT